MKKTVIVKPNKVKTKSNGKQRIKGDAGPIRGQLSSAALAYAAALGNPFDHDCAGVPAEFPPVPSLKTVAWVRGTMTIGTAGFGYVVVNPYMGMANDLGALAVTGAAFTGTTVALTGTGITQPTSNAVYSNASFGANAVLARISAAAVRIYPTMAEVDLNGQLLAGRHPDNRSLTGLSFTDMLKYKETALTPVTSKREAVTSFWQPVNPDETEFVYDTSSVSARYALIACATGTAGKTFAYECFIHVEYAGANVQGRTSSVADPEGMSAVLTAAANTGSGFVGNDESYSRRLIKAAGNIVSELSGPVIGAAVDYLAGPGGGQIARAAMTMMHGQPKPKALEFNKNSYSNHGYLYDRSGRMYYPNSRGPSVEEMPDELKRVATAASLLAGLRFVNQATSPNIMGVFKDGTEVPGIRVDTLNGRSYLILVKSAGLEPACILSVEVPEDAVIKGKYPIEEAATIRRYKDATHDDVFCALRVRIN